MLTTRLTQYFDIEHPVIQAPMAFAAGGKLAAAVSAAGGLGLLGGGYGDQQWLQSQFREAGNQRIGCGLITWALQDNEETLDLVLSNEPEAVFLSFGNPEPYIEKIRNAGSTVICQIQTLRDARHAMDCGAHILVAQGAEAGGHGEKRATMTLVPEVADAISRYSPNTLLCAAGGVGDGRGLAASLMLGADGVVVGSRFWASNEALVHENLLARAVESNGDASIRTKVLDIVRGLDWPQRYDIRILENEFTKQWHNNPGELIDNVSHESKRWAEALEAGDANIANAIAGEVTGLIHSIEPAEQILHAMVAEAETVLGQYP